MERIILYSNNCPKCKILKSKLDSKSIEYELIQDVDLMIEKGFDEVPILEADGKTMKFKDANDWLNNV